MKKRNTRIAAFFVAIAFMLYGVVPVMAQTNNDTDARVAGAASGVTLTFPSGSNTLSDFTITNAAATTRTASIVAASIIDHRGTGAGWYVQFQGTSLGLRGSDAKKRLIKSGGNGHSNVTVSGTYNGDYASDNFGATGSVNAGEFRVRVTTVTAGSITALTITRPNGAAVSPTATSQGASSFTASLQGLTWTFSGSPTYVAGAAGTGDEWGFKVDHFPINQLTLGAYYLAASGSASTTGITLNTAAFAAAESSQSTTRNELVAVNGRGMGAFGFNHDISWILHPTPLAGNYQSIFTYTVVESAP